MRAPFAGRLVVATHNAGKLAEMGELLARFGLEAVSAAALGLAEPEETGLTFADNAAIKALAAARATGLPALSDDSGLCVDGLGGLPGVHSADWAGPGRDWPRAMEAVRAALLARGRMGPPGAGRPIRVHAVPRHARGRYAAVRGRDHGHAPLPATRPPGLWLRPVLRARRADAHVRPDEPRREKRRAGPRPRAAVPSRALAPPLSGRVPRRRSLMPARPDDLFARLSALGIETHTIEHPPLHTVEDSRRLRGEIGGAHSKNLFVKDKKGRLFLIVADEAAELDLKSVHQLIGAQGRVSFGSAELLEEVWGVRPGAVTPFGAINDAAGRVTVVLEAGLMRQDPLNFHPLVNTRTTTIRADDLLAFLRDTGHEPVVVALDVRI